MHTLLCLAYKNCGEPKIFQRETKCHLPEITHFWGYYRCFVAIDGLNVRHRMGRQNKTTVVLFDCGFVFLNTATTIGMVTSGLLRSLNG